MKGHKWSVGDPIWVLCGDRYSTAPREPIYRGTVERVTPTGQPRVRGKAWQFNTSGVGTRNYHKFKMVLDTDQSEIVARFLSNQRRDRLSSVTRAHDWATRLTDDQVAAILAVIDGKGEE